MNEMQVFQNPDFGEIRTLHIEGEPWFIAADVCRALEMDTTQTRRLDADDKGVCSIQTPGGMQQMATINESGLYSLIMGSRKPEAKKFKRWVTGEVLPSIRKHGAYMTPAKIEEVLLNPDTIIKLATDLKAERENSKQLSLQVAQKDQIIGELKPKADYTDRILQSKGTIPITLIAKDYGVSAFRMNQMLHELGIQYKRGQAWVLYSKYQDKGYTHSKTFDYDDSEGRPQVKLTMEWTQRGRLFLYELLKQVDVLPMIERPLAG